MIERQIGVVIGIARDLEAPAVAHREHLIDEANVLFAVLVRAPRHRFVVQQLGQGRVGDLVTTRLNSQTEVDVVEGDLDQGLQATFRREVPRNQAHK